jgi:nucleoside-diphosphate-sugar epimerase
MYLVSGGAGFIGSNIVRRLVENGEKVRVLDDFSTGKRENLNNLEELGKLELVEGSLTDLGAVREAVTGVQFIFHQAAIPSVPRSIAEPLISNAANITGTLNLLEAAREAGVKRVIYAASSSAYGDTTVLPKVESMAADPMSPYAVGKYTGELYARIYSTLHGIETVSLRYFNIFGPRQDPASEYAAVIPKFIQAMLRGEAPTIYGDGKQTRDFTYIDNAVEANLLACKSDQVGRGEVVNIACGERYSLNQLVGALNDILGTSISPVYSDPKPGDVKHSLADISRAKELLGYEVKVGFREGLEHTVEWFRQVLELKKSEEFGSKAYKKSYLKAREALNQYKGSLSNIIDHEREER